MIQPEQAVDGWRYSLPPRKYVVNIVISPIMLTLWGIVLATHGRDMGIGAFFFIAFWLLCVYSWLMQAIGKELVTISFSGSLRIQHRVLGFERTREYFAAEMGNFRMMEPPKSRRLAPFEGGRVGFDYRGQTIRLGAGLDAEQAAALIAELSSRFT